MRCVTVFLLAFCVIACAGKKKRYNGYKVFRSVPENRRELKAFNNLENSRLGQELDFWQSTTRKNMPVNIMVRPELQGDVLDFLREKGIRDVSTAIEDVQELIESNKGPSLRTDVFDYENFNRISTINQWIADAAASSPIATNGTIGNSYEGRPINYLKISNSTGEDKPAVVLWACLHAREWLACSTVIYMTKYFLEEAPGVSELLRKFDFYIIPVMNPDGYEYSHTNDRFWRKNRTPDSSSRCVGTDLNRNFGVSWESIAADIFAPRSTSRKPCSFGYGGSAPFSEPESEALRNFLEDTLGGGKLLDGSGNGTVAMVIDYHTFAQFWMYPYAYREWPGDKRRKIRPGIYNGDVDINLKNRELMDTGASIAVDALFEVHNTSYRYGDIFNIIYAVAGSGLDYTYEKLNVVFSYAIEGRENIYGPRVYGFAAPPSEIKPSGEENWAALKALCDYIHNVYNPS